MTDKSSGILGTMFPNVEPKPLRRPANPLAATPVPEQKEATEEAEKSQALPDQVDFSALLGGSEEEEPGSIPELPSFKNTLTDEALMNLAKSVNFTPHIPQEIREQHPEISAAMEQLAKASYLTALKHAGALSDEANSALDKRFSAQSQSSIREFEKETPYRDSEITGNAALKVVVDTLRKEYPTAPPDWIKTQAKKAMIEFGKQAADELEIPLTNPPSVQAKANPEKIDWLRFAGFTTEVQ